MSRLGGFDGLEVALLRQVGGCSIGREVGGAGLRCGAVEVFSEKGEQGGPPGLRGVERAFGGGVGGENVVRRERCRSNQASRESLVGRGGG